MRAKSELPAYSQLASESDESLMEYLQQGHPDALAQLFDRYHGLVFGVASRILRDTGESEDMAQAVFLEIFQSAAQYDKLRGSVKIWILQYAYHRSFNRRRYLILRGFYEHPDEIGSHHECPLSSYGESPERVESIQALQEAFRSLSKAQRDTLVLAFYEGFTIREISDKMGWSLDNVKHHYYRGLEKLRAVLCEKPDRSQNTSPEDCLNHAES
jgi:RNA polymerase sigma-70 factor (ECF subfamily)